MSGSEKQLKEAAKAGHIEAMLELAKIKLNGLYEPYPFGGESFDSGIYYLQMASGKGSLEATLELANIYEDGWHGGFPEDWHFNYDKTTRLEDALACYEQAQKLGWKAATAHITRIQKLLDIEDD